MTEAHSFMQVKRMTDKRRYVLNGIVIATLFKRKERKEEKNLSF
jgi:hypothetical protein